MKNVKLTKKLVQISGNDVPAVAGLVSRQIDQKALRSDYVDFVDGFENQIQDAFFLKEVLPVSQSPQLILFFLVF